MSTSIVNNLYKTQFGCEPAHIIVSPGRVNVIGEHTDYNQGFVFPMAIDRAVYLAFTPRKDKKIVLHSDAFKETLSIDLECIEKTGQGWLEYVKGIANEMGALQGFDGVVYSDLPNGAGLSSSAAFELAVAKALTITASGDWDPVQAAILAQKAENNWVGVSCGIMDQLICAVGKEKHATLIDCRDLSYQSAPLPPQTKIVIMDTGTRRGLKDSAYNDRREACDEAARIMGVSSLRDATLDNITQLEPPLPEKLQNRALHVVSENLRVQKAAQAMRAGDPKTLGDLLKRSHQSLRDKYEVSCPELDTMVEIANEQSACYGARMTGAGFGGCAVALVSEDSVESFCKDVSKAYKEKTGIEPAIFGTTPSEGCSSFRV